MTPALHLTPALSDPFHRTRIHPPTSCRGSCPIVTTTLHFDLPAALRLAEHAAAAAEHRQSYTESDTGVACPGALLWVADAGVYLMSGGIPGLRVDPTDDTSRHEIVYADGFTDA